LLHLLHKIHVEPLIVEKVIGATHRNSEGGVKRAMVMVLEGRRRE